jgi:hypothetical protein
MKLKNCDPGINGFVLSPLITRKPDPKWKAMAHSGGAPAALYKIYSTHNFFSFDKIVPYANDPDKLIYNFFKDVTGSIFIGFNELKDLRRVIKSHDSKVYNPIKTKKTKKNLLRACKSDEWLVRYLKLYFVTAMGIFDQLAVLTSMVFPGSVNRLLVEKADFGKILTWSKSPLNFPTIRSPQQHRLDDLHKCVNAGIYRSDDQADWHRLLDLYRNKLAHLGSGELFVLRIHDEKLKFGGFMPMIWPFFISMHLNKSRGSKTLIDKLSEYMNPLDINEYLAKTHHAILDFSNKYLTPIAEELESIKNNVFDQSIENSLKKTETFLFKGYV